MDTTKKIIRGVVSGRGFTTTSPITQWDYGWQFIPEIEDLPATYRLDFSNEEKHGTALPVYCGTDGAEVPTELIDTGKDVWVWYVAIGEGYGITEYKWRILNKCKPKTEQDEPTPSQQSSIDQAISVVNDAVETVEQKASEASASAQSASQSAESAEQSAQASANSAEQAHQFAQTASLEAESAQDYATQAQASARASAQSAQSAEQSARTASAKADAITGLTATATTLPSGSSASAIYNPQTGVMSFGIPKGKDGTNGDDGYSPSVTVTDITGGHRVAITDKTGTKNFDVMDGDDYILTEEDKEEIADMVEVPSDWLKAFPTDTASGAVASFTDGADNLPLKSVKIDTDATTAKVTRTGENLLNITKTSAVQGGVTVTVEDGIITLNGTATIQLGLELGSTVELEEGEYWIGGIPSGSSGTTYFMTKNGSSGNTYEDSTFTTSGALRPRLYIRSGVTLDNVEFVPTIAKMADVYDVTLTDGVVQEEITSLYGINNVWSDSGDVTVEYRADSDLYIRRKMPDVPVDDVQINGTSIVQDGVAIVPIANSSTLGTVMSWPSGGTRAEDGKIGIYPAQPSSIKSGAATYQPIVPNTQHQSVFYGLAKVAGSDEKSSTLPVGQYTEEAKVAIQKMLGIYEAPWELIREDTFTNAEEADHIISTDANGEAFELTDVVLLFETPKQSTEAKKGYSGQVHYKHNSSNVFVIPASSWTQSANAESMGFYQFIERKDGLIFVSGTAGGYSGNPANLRFTPVGNLSTSLPYMGVVPINDNKTVTSINIKSVTGTGHYRLYGKRKP